MLLKSCTSPILGREFVVPLNEMNDLIDNKQIQKGLGFISHKRSSNEVPKSKMRYTNMMDVRTLEDINGKRSLSSARQCQLWKKHGNMFLS